ncbi:MAG: toll/interleukin-1 receptor domain-containing protein, partial [Prevotella sp.]|nr:toll/interleukin-1 receptor domain-containing protein [Prevotella sp.]
MEQKRKYFAFISYSHKDSEMAKWLQHEFEYYDLSSTLFEVRKDLRKEDFPASFRPVFRDEDELAGGDLKPQISEALAASEYLIVVCSPNSAQSNYVDSEIKEFISLSPE